MKDYSVLAGSLGTPRPKPPCEPQFKPFTDEPWSKADGYAVVDARSGGRCECSPDCTDPAEVHHHVAGRGGPDPHRPSNILAMSDRHHRKVHASPRESYRLGLMKSRLGQVNP